MAYLSSSAPIPQNSTMPPPAWEGPALLARLQRNAEYSRTGRERVYANMPTAASLWALCPGLAVDANGVIQASELARQMVLNGIAPPQDMQAASTSNTGVYPDLYAGGATGQASLESPTVIPLNAAGPVSSAPATPLYPTIPAAAPTQVGNLLIESPPAPMGGRMKTARSYSPKGGPGCGLSGFAPAWGDAYALPAAPLPGAGNVGLWALAGVGALVLLFSRKGR